MTDRPPTPPDDSGAPTRPLLARLQRLTLAIEQSPAAVLITDTDGRIEYVNRRFTEMSGYTAAEVMGQTPRLLKSGLTPPSVYQQLWTTISAGQAWRGELCNRRKDGSLYWHSASISPVRDEAGGVTGFVAVQEDITEQRQIREALERSERNHRRIVETASEGIWEVDAEHRTVFVNERLATMLGYEVREMLGRPVFDFTDAEGRVIAEASRQRRRQGIREQQDFKLQRKDGSTLWVLMSTGPILGDAGEYLGALAMVTDLTERREAEAGIRQSEAWFRALIEESEDLISVLDEDGAFRYVSPSFERILGLRPVDLVGKPAFSFVHPDDLEKVVAVFSEGVNEAGTTRRLQFRFRHQDGTWRLIEGIGRSLFHDPVVRGAVINGRDITERAALEAPFRQAQKLEAVGRMVGGVAHDFNNILAVILGTSEILQSDLAVDHPSHEDVAEIRRAAERGATLTRQLLAYSRQQVLLPRLLDLNALVRNLEGMLSRMIGEDVALVMRLQAGTAMVKADPGQLEQVLLNLAVNSRDAMPEGGQLLLETSVVELDEHYAALHPPMAPGWYVSLTVSDTGSGMSEEVRSHAFEPFFTTKESGKGTGLGLATVYGIVKQSDGFVWLYSEPGRGTSFKIFLPMVSEAADPVRPAAADAPASLRGTETILIAEDNTAVRMLTRKALERQGYTVLETTGADAMEVAGSHPGPIHLLLTDTVMPGVTGPALAAQLAEARPGLRVLHMSGYTDNAPLLTQVMASGGAFLQKPFTVASLARKVRSVLDGVS